MSKPDHVPLISSRDLFTDEKVWELREALRFNETTQCEHRIQRIQVNRDDRLIWFEKDLGANARYNDADPLAFWAAWEYNVGEVMEIAAHLRENKPEPQLPRDLVGDYIKFKEEQCAQKVRRSVSGSVITIQRSGV